MIKVIRISILEKFDARLMFYASMSNEAAAIVAKDKDVPLLLLTYALGQLKFVLPPQWYMKINSNQFINTDVIWQNNLVRELSHVPPQLHSITSCDTTSYKFNVGKVCVFKKVYKDPFSLTAIRMLGLSIIMTEDIFQKPKNLFKL